MTPQDPTPSMEFWVSHDPMVKREKEMKVREIFTFNNKKKKKEVKSSGEKSVKEHVYSFIL